MHHEISAKTQYFVFSTNSCYASLTHNILEPINKDNLNNKLIKSLYIYQSINAMLDMFIDVEEIF